MEMIAKGNQIKKENINREENNTEKGIDDVTIGIHMRIILIKLYLKIIYSIILLLIVKLLMQFNFN